LSRQKLKPKILYVTKNKLSSQVNFGVKKKGHKKIKDLMDLIWMEIAGFFTLFFVGFLHRFIVLQANPMAFWFAFRMHIRPCKGDRSSTLRTLGVLITKVDVSRKHKI